MYPKPVPWSCNVIVGWLGLVIACVTLVLVCILYFPGREHHHSDTDWDRRMIDSPSSSSSIGAIEPAHENYVAFRFEAERNAAATTRWPKTGVIAGLTLDDIVATSLCCVVGTQQYLVCDSTQGLTDNLGISYVVRNLAEEHGAHLLMRAASADMSGSQCTFSWQTRLHEHDKAALVVAKEDAEGAVKKRRFAHTHRGRRD
jgi:hypothetical protein